MATPPPPSSPVPPVGALRALTIREHGPHSLRKAVRAVYRAQRRPPQREAVLVAWIERIVRRFPDTPLGQIARLRGEAVLRRLRQRRALRPKERRRAREALRFLRDDVLAEPASTPSRRRRGRSGGAAPAAD